MLSVGKAKVTRPPHWLPTWTASTSVENRIRERSEHRREEREAAEHEAVEHEAAAQANQEVAPAEAAETVEATEPAETAEVREEEPTESRSRLLIVPRPYGRSALASPFGSCPKPHSNAR